jgi:alpha-L-rhamnosidase
MEWQAQWVWGGSEASPRNAWRCFRKLFELPEAVEANVAITADTRYVLFVNGQRVGRGPARSWPFRYAYDRYEVGHLLKPGKANVLAVLVMHHGVSTFQSLRNRGGLLAQLELGKRTIVTDSRWKTTPHAGHDPRSPRMSVQLGFAERVDARVWDDSWLEADYDDSAWEDAVVLGPVGTPPWNELVPRSIPHLSEEPRYASRVAALRAVRPVAYTAVIDLCAQLMPDSANHSNAVRYAGYLATCLRLPVPTRLTLGSPLATVSVFGACYINGVPCDPASAFGEDPERYVQLELPAGEHLVLIETSGDDRSGVGLHLLLDSEAPFELVSPLGEGMPTPYVTLGPFDEAVVIDHQPNPQLEPGTVYERVKEARTAEELRAFAGWLKPVPEVLLSRDDVFATCIRPRSSAAHPVTAALQHAVTASPDAGVVPLLEGWDSELVIDFGVETSGFLSFEVDASEGTILDLYGFEYMAGDLRQDTFGLDNTLRYVCREGRQRYLSAVRRGLRYLMVVVRRALRPLKIIDLHILESTYPTPEIGQFACSDALLKDIWEMSRRTLKLCMEDSYVDCPAYEQTFWVGDARNAALVNHYVFGADALTERCLELVPLSKVHTPLYTDQVPSGWNSVIPNWTFLWVIACKEHYERTGNRAFAAAMWPQVRFTLEHYLKKLDARGLLSHYGWNFLDWAPIDQPRDGVVAHQAMFLVKALRSAAELAVVAGESTVGFEDAAKELAAAVNHHFWSEARGAYRDAIDADGRPSATFSMQTQVVAYLCGVATGERRERLMHYLVKPPENFVSIGSPFMSFFYYEVLAELGRVNLILDDIRSNYGRMLEHGATTCWEMYPGSANRANVNFLTRSHCHAWSAAPAFFLSACVLGVRPAAPGWTRIIVMPEPCGLAWAKGRVPLPSGGCIEVSWTVHGEDAMELTVHAPRGVAVDARLPQGIDGYVEVSAVEQLEEGFQARGDEL